MGCGSSTATTISGTKRSPPERSPHERSQKVETPQTPRSEVVKSTKDSAESDVSTLSSKSDAPKSPKSEIPRVSSVSTLTLPEEIHPPDPLPVDKAQPDEQSLECVRSWKPLLLQDKHQIQWPWKDIKGYLKIAPDVPTFVQRVKTGQGLDKRAKYVFIVMNDGTVRYFNTDVNVEYPGTCKDYPNTCGHSSMLTPSEFAIADKKPQVHFAGEFKTDPNGQLIKWNRRSGHFQPTPDHGDLFHRIFQFQDHIVYNQERGVARQELLNWLNDYFDDDNDVSYEKNIFLNAQHFHPDLYSGIPVAQESYNGHYNPLLYVYVMVVLLFVYLFCIIISGVFSFISGFVAAIIWEDKGRIKSDDKRNPV